jgi:hypothetical protein
MIQQKLKNVKYEVITKELTKLQKLTNNKNLTTLKLRGHFNCWGFTAYAFQWIKELVWFDKHEMEYCIDRFTRIIKKPRVGDIVVFRNSYGEIEHTAIFTNLDTFTIIHKPGYLRLEVDTIDNVKLLYEEIDFDRITFNRAIKNKTFNFNRFCKSDFNEEYDCYGEKWDEDFA